MCALMRHSCQMCYEALHLSLVHLSSMSWVLRTWSISGGPSLRLLTLGPGSSCQTDGEFSNNTSFIRTNNDSGVLGPPPSLAFMLGRRPTPSPAAPRPSAFLLSSIFLHFPGGEPLTRSLAITSRPPARRLSSLPLFPAIFGDPCSCGTTDGLRDSRRCDCAKVQFGISAVSFIGAPWGRSSRC